MIPQNYQLKVGYKYSQNKFFPSRIYFIAISRIVITLLIFIFCKTTILSQETGYNGKYFKDQLISNYYQLDKIEGIWKIVCVRQPYTFVVKDEIPNPTFGFDDHFIIKKYGSHFYSYNLPFYDWESFSDKWVIKEAYGLTFTKTAMDNLYLVEYDDPLSENDWENGKITIINDGYIKFNFRIATAQDGEEIKRLKPLEELSEKEYVSMAKNYARSNKTLVEFTEYSYEMTKVFPTEGDLKIYNSNISKKVSATGFSINTKGYIITNYHVVKDAKRIIIKGINGDFNKGIEANIVKSDPNNDIVILKIQGEDIIRNEIPYSINDQQSNLGEKVFTLGYPLRSTMGDDIKLTDGIISSKSGYQGNITEYQLSTPVHPGNSGGPVFDEQGNIIGIISSKHKAAENVSYAVKSQYLNLLLENLDLKSEQTQTQLNHLIETSELIKNIVPFIYIIEAE